APERKRELPEVIKRIALITADGSAALEDFLKILREYNSAIEIDLYPVSVQGQKSVMEIVQTFAQIKEDTEKSDVDAIVLTRGGGSLEDLGSFNSEDVAKAIFSSPTPVVCAVGHEVDISIADMVADVRASTPSQAAYYLASRNEQFINLANQILDSIERSLRELMPRTDQLDNVAQKLSQNIDSILPNRAQIDEQMGMISMKLRQSVPMPESVDPTVQKLNWGLINLDRDIKQKFTKVSQQQELLKAYNPS
ncbi:MAG: exodeoxyribonuclease VII large subunit, partial [Candidatus Dojkabacteria bacterium]